MKMKMVLICWFAGAGLALAQDAAVRPPASFSGTFSVGGSTAGSNATFTVKGPMVTVDTDRYKVEVVDMGVSQIVNKRTGLVFCRAGSPNPGGRASLLLKDYRPGQPERTFVHVPADPSAPPPGVVQKWMPLVPAKFTSTGGATGTIGADGVVMVTGTLAKDDTYTLQVVLPVAARAFKLEPLSDAYLPAHGPGRAFNGNFVVSRFAVSFGADGAADTPNPVTFSGAEADSERQNMGVAGAIDDKPETGWAITGEAGKNHMATFTVSSNVKLPAGAPVTITIEQKSQWADHTIGKFRLSVMEETRQAAGAGDASIPRTYVKRLPRGVEYTVTGLTCPGDENTRRYYPNAMLGMRVEFDEKTGDLLLTPMGKAGRPSQLGVFDEGIFATTFSVGPFDKDVQVIHPSGLPSAIHNLGGWWPLEWTACLTVFQASNGECASIWADDGKLEFGKRFWAHDGIMDYHTVNGDAPWRVGEMAAPIWRLNVFDSWEAAGMRYREVMERTLNIVPLEKCDPPWISKIRLVTHQVFGAANLKSQYIDKGVPAEAMIEFDTQGWLNGYGTEIMSAKRPEWIPNYPFDNPTGYEGYPGYGNTVKERQNLGVAVFPYTCMFTTLAAPFEQSTRVLRAPGMDFSCGGRMWWVLYANMMEDLVKKYGVKGLYDDCSWIGPKYDPRGKVDGLNVWQAHAWGRKYLRDRLLPVYFKGERQHEITIVSDRMALMWIGGPVHPLNNYLFSPYTIRWNQAAENWQGRFLQGGAGACDWNLMFEFHNSLDADETLLCIPMTSTGKYLGETMRQETALIRKRMFFWAQQMLTPYFPKKYGPGVVGVLRGKDGAEYRMRNTGGMGLVRLKQDGEQVVWWRSKEVSEFACQGAAIEGWVAYKGNRAIGLNPGVRYVALEDNARPPVTISEMPKGVFLASSRIGNGYWAVNLGGAGMPGPAELSVSSGGKKLSFIGAEAVGAPTADGVYRVKVGAGGAFAACWDRAPTAIGTLPVKLGTPAGRLEVLGMAGVVVSSFDAPKEAAPGSGVTLVWDTWFPGHVRTADYLVTLPAQAAAIKATVGGDRGTARVRVNGKVVGEVPHGGGSTPLKASLAGFAGQTVLLSFECAMQNKVQIESPQIVAAE